MWVNGVRKLIAGASAGFLLLASLPAQALDPHKAFHHYVRDSWSIEQGLPQITATAITQDRLGYLWIGTQAGVARLDGVRFVTYNMDNVPELPGLFINALLIDRDDRLWIATYKGLAVHEHGRIHAAPAPRTTTTAAISRSCCGCAIRPAASCFCRTVSCRRPNVSA